MAFGMAPHGNNGPVRFTVTWDDQSHSFYTFEQARNFLANEIWWMYEDDSSTEGAKAWETVVDWAPPPGWGMWRDVTYEVKLGDPAATYKIAPEFS